MPCAVISNPRTLWCRSFVSPACYMYNKGLFGENILFLAQVPEGWLRLAGFMRLPCSFRDVGTHLHGN